jgi:hypothetical protein
MTGTPLEILSRRTVSARSSGTQLTLLPAIRAHGPAMDARRYVFPRFPFSLVYRLRGDEVEVIAVAHGRRRPAAATLTPGPALELPNAAAGAPRRR